MPKTTTGRIVKPKSPKDGLDLAAKVYAKHQSDGATSELNNLDGFSWNTVGPTIQQAQKFHDDAEAAKAEMEKLYRKRDAAYTDIEAITNASSTYLKGKYSKTPKKLGDWGYQIDDTPPVKKPKTPAA